MGLTCARLTRSRHATTLRLCVLSPGAKSPGAQGGRSGSQASAGTTPPPPTPHAQAATRWGFCALTWADQRGRPCLIKQLGLLAPQIAPGPGRAAASRERRPQLLELSESNPSPRVGPRGPESPAACQDRPRPSPATPPRGRPLLALPKCAPAHRGPRLPLPRPARAAGHAGRVRRALGEVSSGLRQQETLIGDPPGLGVPEPEGLSFSPPPRTPWAPTPGEANQALLIPPFHPTAER
jgi:hypothetical protein